MAASSARHCVVKRVMIGIYHSANASILQKSFSKYAAMPLCRAYVVHEGMAFQRARIASCELHSVDTVTARTSQTNLDYLQAELTRMDVLIRRYAQLCAVERQAQAQRSQSNVPLFHAAAHALLEIPLGSNWGPLVGGTPPGDDPWIEVYAQAAEQSEAIANLARLAGETPHLARLAALFALNNLEIDILLLALLPSLDPRYTTLFAYLCDEPLLHFPSVDLILNILCAPGLQRLRSLSCFTADAPLFRAQLLQWHSEPDPAAAPLLSRTLTVDPAIVTWLLGDYQIPALLHTCLQFTLPEDDTTDALLAAETLPRLLAALHGQSLICLYGADQEAQVATVRRLAYGGQLPLLTFSIDDAVHAGVAPQAGLQLALREAGLTGAILHLIGVELWLRDGALPTALMAEIESYPGRLVISSKTQWKFPGHLHSKPMLWLEAPLPTYAQRLALWQHFLGGQIELTSVNLEMLASYSHLSGAEIRLIVTSARDSAAMRGETIQAKELFAFARTHANTHLDFLANKLTPRFSWSDLVVPHHQLTILQEIVAVVRGRHQVLEKWGVGQKLVSSAAITMLFAGEPGTGKTMAAEVIARDLELDLYKIDLSSLVSKYIGETEKNLEHIFTEAERSQAILFFDEADSVFGKRTGIQDSHDRYANIGVSYLLQRIEAYTGITILATNLRANLDEAFTRRIQFIVDFPFPDADDRLRIWQALWPAGVPSEPDLDFTYLAQRLKLAGGNIRNILVLAAYLAAEEGVSLGMRHLQHAARRELQKMGRILSEADLQAPVKETSKDMSSPPAEMMNSRIYRTRRT